MLECYDFEECEYNAQPKCCLPDGMVCPHGAKAHKPTNADRIRAMSDEELAKKLTMLFWQVAQKTNAEHYILDWLQQPAEENT